MHEIYQRVFGAAKAIKGLDGLRAICVLFVLTDHAGLTKTQETGTLAVWVFFALSGFLIVPILFKARQRIEAGTSDGPTEIVLFMRNRALRIFPIYYLTLALIFMSTVTVVSGDNVDKFYGSIGWILTYTTNIYIGFVRHDWLGPLSHLWTLSVEQQFYVFFPLLFIWLPSRFWRSAMLVSLLVLLVVSCWWAFDDVLKFRVNSLSGFYAIAVGGLFGLAARRLGSIDFRFSGLLIAALGVVLVLQHLYFVLNGHPNAALIIAPLLAGFLIMLLAVCQNSTATQFLEIPLIRGVGVVSYGFYLFHNLLLGPSGRLVALVTGMREGTTFQIVQIATAFVLTMIVSIISFIFFEERLMQLKKRRAPSAAVAAGSNG
ncbi:acyltransferase [Rhizobium sp. BK377]|uniref:acyltransferase family protein n=1 Tax=Rhizobium sp. BK377 TaxID=2587058 RepID=UPI00160BC97A|nr:acyltransferase [Rhizobium sp. BK377]MBB3464858.1 peptidoglycan/LPS O-acetylase OafA/YrhL [Rhizobium sp. BK377]